MHDGRFMRYHKASPRALEVLTGVDVPLRSDGWPDLCIWCQFTMRQQGGYIEMLAARLEGLAKRDLRRIAGHWGAFAYMGVGDTVERKWISHSYQAGFFRAAKSVAGAFSWSIRMRVIGRTMIVERLT